MRFSQVDIRSDLIGACNDQQEYYIGSFSDATFTVTWSIFGMYSAQSSSEYVQMSIEQFEDDVQDEMKKLPAFDEHFSYFIVEQTDELIEDGYFDGFRPNGPIKSLLEIVNQLKNEVQ